MSLQLGSGPMRSDENEDPTIKHLEIMKETINSTQSNAKSFKSDLTRHKPTRKFPLPPTNDLVGGNYSTIMIWNHGELQVPATLTLNGCGGRNWRQEEGAWVNWRELEGGGGSGRT
ncbi:hypothetical protein E2C01_047089 [Portunus trituberculatus]|uniref:Uncharacterized protein n=1 Tax=Portunus trituberculatus TaxID=210409 RepID=A0A5B7G082_PORTR|nr:hypothetical protein [Portunus trituberculatus]